MTLLCAEMPEQLDQVKPWLERWLVRPELFDLVAELHALRQPGRTPASVSESLGEQWGKVLRQGLAPLGSKELGMLLTNPVLLLEMQELIVEQGGDYWRRMFRESATTDDPPIAMQTEIVDGERLVPLKWHRRPILVGLISAVSVASILVAVYVLHLRPAGNQPQGEVAAAGWGWAKPGALPQDLSRSEYLQRLGADADEWHKKIPNTRALLATRLHEFRLGCTTLLISENRPLTAADKEWLLRRCREWANAIDQLLARVEASNPADPIERIRADADRNAKEIAAELRKRVNA